MESRQTKLEKNTASNFSTQAMILRQLQNSNGICSQLANLYADYRMGNGNRLFLDGEAEQICNEIIRISNAQKNVEDTYGGNLGALLSMNIAFFNNNILFKTDLHAVDKMATKSGFEESISDSKHVLISYPTENKNISNSTSPYHQVYFGEIKDNKCVYFNINIEGGEREGECNEIISLVTSDIEKHSGHDGRPCLVTRSI